MKKDNAVYSAKDFLDEALAYEQKAHEAAQLGDFVYAQHCRRMCAWALEDAASLEKESE